MEFELTLKGNVEQVLKQIQTAPDGLEGFLTQLLHFDDKHLGGALGSTLRHRLRSSSVFETEDPAIPNPAAAPWSYEEMARFWKGELSNGLSLTPGAKQILSIIAKHTEGCTKAQLLDELSRAQNHPADPKAVGGRLSSVGHIHKATPEKERIYWLDEANQQYRMRPEVAEIVLQLTRESPY